VTTYSAAGLRKLHKRQERETEARRNALMLLKRGAVLRRHHDASGIVWTVSSAPGLKVPDKVARQIIAYPQVVDVGDALAAWGPAQSYRWVG
jgi:hypothetical protein